MSTALIDADIPAYVAASQATDDDWADELGSITHTGRACQAAIDSVEAWAEGAGCDEILLCFSSKRGLNFRKSICPSYKAHRGEKPEAYAAVVEAMEASFDVRRIEGMEADDVLGVLATNGEFTKPVVCTIDKDAHTVPSRLYNPRKTKGRPWRISRGDADRYWLTQALMGDSADGYKGVPGIGPKKAAQLLAPCATLAEMWPVVLDAYIGKNLTQTEALLNVRMARILRAEDYSEDCNSVRLWGPDTLTTEWMVLPE